MPSTTQELMQLKGLVSNETLLSLLPFVGDVDEEMKKVQQEQHDAMELYSFNQEVTTDEDETEDEG